MTATSTIPRRAGAADGRRRTPAQRARSTALHATCVVIGASIVVPLLFGVLGGFKDNGQLYDKYYNGSAWVWEPQGTPPGSSTINSPAVVYQCVVRRFRAPIPAEKGHAFRRIPDTAVGSGATDLGKP